MTNHENKKNRSAIAFKGGHRHNIGAPVIKAKILKILFIDFGLI